MPVFFVTFNLNHEDGYKHYDSFTEELRKMRAHRVMNDACLINVSTSNPQTLLEHLRQFTEEHDRLFAARIDTQNSYYLHTYPGTNEWIEDNPLDGPLDGDQPEAQSRPH